MAIKVHGSPFSPPTLRVLVCLEEIGLDYEFTVVDMRNKQHKSPSYLALNPFGQVPVLEDDDLKLFESRAITQYLAHKYIDHGTPLIPKDSKKMAIAAVWAEVENSQFNTPASGLSFEYRVKPMLGMTINETTVEELKEKLSKVLDVYESRLSESKYLGGDDFSLADLHHIPLVNNLLAIEKVKPVFDARPHVSAWAADILARPAWSKVQEKTKH